MSTNQPGEFEATPTLPVEDEVSERAAPGMLFVSASGFPLPIEVRDTRLRMVARGRTGASLSLPAGRYLVTAVLPGGDTLEAVATIEPDEVSTILLYPDLMNRESRGEQREHISAVGRVADRRLIRYGHLFAGGLAAAAMGSFGPGWIAYLLAAPALYGLIGGLPGGETSDAPEGSAPPERLWLRFLRLHGLREVEVVDSPDVVQIETEDSVLELRICANHGSPGDVQFVQLAVPGQIPVTVALPLADSGCFVIEVRVGGSSLSVTPRFSDPALDVASAYLAGGQLREAGEVLEATDAKHLLSSPRDPIATAASVYILLRLGHLDVPHDWLHHLIFLYPWFPDGPIIAGEVAARDGDIVAALEYFRMAVRRGPPVFSEGYSTLLSRARQFGRENGVEIGDPREASMADVANVLQLWAGYTDFRSILFNVRGGDVLNPAESQVPFREPDDDWVWAGARPAEVPAR